MLTKEECDVGMVIMKYVIKNNRARLASYGIDDDEAVSMGLVGLSQAIHDYDAATCRADWFKFAYQLIWQSIFQSPSTKKSRRQVIIDSGIKRIRDLYFQKTGKKLTDEKLAYLLDANKKFPELLRDHFRKTETIHYKITEDGEHRGVTLADSRVPLPEDAGTLSNEYFVGTIRNIINDENDETRILDDDERRAVKSYFGIGVPRFNIQAIAKYYHHSQRTISEHLKSGLEKLKCDSRLKELHLDLVEA